MHTPTHTHKCSDTHTKKIHNGRAGFTLHSFFRVLPSKRSHTKPHTHTHFQLHTYANTDTHILTVTPTHTARC